MCGRFALYSSVQSIIEYSNALNKIDSNFKNFNVAPGTMIPVIFSKNGEIGESKALTQMRWGLIPFWAKDDKFASKLINAKSETIADKPSFRNAFQRRRCLIPANGYFEWRQKDKKPFYLHLPQRELFCFAGIWESWKAPDNSIITTCSIITKEASDNISHIHHRMPVILPKAEEENWLNGKQPSRLINILYQKAVRNLEYYPVSIAINSAQNNYPQLLESLAE